MQVILVRKKTVVVILALLTIFAAVLLFMEHFGSTALGVIFNNDKIMPICSVEVPDKRIALTFDAAWGDSETREILDTLKRYDIRATFFVTGTWAGKYPGLIHDMAGYNHEIGNHSLTHIKMTDLSRKDTIYEIKGTESIIEKLTGKKTKLFRAPFGAFNEELVSTARSIDYNMIQWDTDSSDWQGKNAQQICSSAESSIENGSILIFHSNTVNTASTLSYVIERLRGDGYIFETVSELLLKENYYIDNTGRQRSLK